MRSDTTVRDYFVSFGDELQACIVRREAHRDKVASRDANQVTQWPVLPLSRQTWRILLSSLSISACLFLAVSLSVVHRRARARASFARSRTSCEGVNRQVQLVVRRNATENASEREIHAPGRCCALTLSIRVSVYGENNECVSRREWTWENFFIRILQEMRDDHWEKKWIKRYFVEEIREFYSV